MNRQPPTSQWVFTTCSVMPLSALHQPRAYTLSAGICLLSQRLRHYREDGDSLITANSLLKRNITAPIVQKNNSHLTLD